MNIKANINVKSLTRLVRLMSPRLVRTKDFFFKKHLMATNISISITFSGLGDIIEQYIERVFLHTGPARWDTIRTSKLASTGLPVGILSHYWYLQLDKRFAQTSHLNVLRKIVASQLIYAPACILVFFLTLGVLNRTHPNEIWFNIESKGKRLYMVDWITWPPISLVNFYLIPLRYRLLYENVVSIGFDVFNSYVYHNHPEKYKTRRETVENDNNHKLVSLNSVSP